MQSTEAEHLKALKEDLLERVIDIYERRVATSSNGTLRKGELKQVFSSVGSPTWLTKSVFFNALNRRRKRQEQGQGQHYANPVHGLPWSIDITGDDTSTAISSLTTDDLESYRSRLTYNGAMRQPASGQPSNTVETAAVEEQSAETQPTEPPRKRANLGGRPKGSTKTKQVEFRRKVSMVLHEASAKFAKEKEKSSTKKLPQGCLQSIIHSTGKQHGLSTPEIQSS